jgi:hypothetical protein
MLKKRRLLDEGSVKKNAKNEQISVVCVKCKEKTARGIFL